MNRPYGKLRDDPTRAKRGVAEVKKNETRTAGEFLAYAQHSLAKHHLPRIERCLRLLLEKGIWWRPNPSSNSVGNLVLHLEGNIRQWIISGLGGAPDCRERDREFAERGPIPRHALLARLRATVRAAIRLLGKLSSNELGQVYSIQGFRVTGLKAIAHVVEHLAYHSGQIVYVTKLKRGVDLGFTGLPGQRARKRGARNLPAI